MERHFGPSKRIGKVSRGTKQQRNRRKFGYILYIKIKQQVRNKKTVHGGSADKTISAGKTNVQGRPDSILNVQQAFLQPLLKKIVKKAKKDLELKR